MRLFHTTNYKIYNKNLLKDLKIVIISDLHFSKLVTDKKLDLITSEIKKINPDYILIPGDIINSLDEIDDTFEYNRLLSWINNLGTTILSIGGHDFYKKNNSNWKYQDPDKLIKGINSLKKAHILNNSKYEDAFIFITGYTQSI